MTVQSSQKESKTTCSLNFNPGLMCVCVCVWGGGGGGGGGGGILVIKGIIKGNTAKTVKPHD